MRLRQLSRSLIVAGWVCRSAHALAAGATAIPDEVTHLRDPFKRPVINNGSAVPKSDLELFPLDKFKLVAVMTGPSRLRAMVEAPNGKSYFVWENVRIGLHKGIVRRITPDAIHVRERVVNVLGQEENVDSDIRMPEPTATLEASKSSTAAPGAGVTAAAEQMAARAPHVPASAQGADASSPANGGANAGTNGAANSGVNGEAAPDPNTAAAASAPAAGQSGQAAPTETPANAAATAAPASGAAAAGNGNSTSPTGLNPASPPVSPAVNGGTPAAAGMNGSGGAAPGASSGG